MKDYVKRMSTEIKDLFSKIEKLEAFIDSDKYRQLDDLNKFLLRQQLLSMKAYFGILEKRIDLACQS